MGQNNMFVKKKLNNGYTCMYVNMSNLLISLIGTSCQETGHETQISEDLQLIQNIE